MSKTKMKKRIVIFSIILFLLIAIVSIIMYFSIKEEDDYHKKLINSNYDFVYTYKEINSTKFPKQIPHINLDVKNINEEIDNFVLEYINKDDNIITYNYSVSNNALSLIIRIISFAEKNAPINHFKSFNINLDTLEEVSNDEVLRAYNINSTDVQNKIEAQFKDYYYDLVFAEKINEQVCNLECFIERRGFFGYMQDTYYYIDNGKLIVYKPFIINSSAWEYEYFKDTDFSFKIVE